MAKSNILASIMVVVVVVLLLQGPAAMAARCISTNGEGDCLKLYADGGEAADGKEGRLQEVYSITGNVSSNIFTMRLELEYAGSVETAPFKCTGIAKGLFTPGFGYLINPSISSDNIQALVKDARTFGFLGTSLFLSFTIYGSGRQTLGRVPTGALSFVNGLGKGSMKCEFAAVPHPLS